MYLCLSMQVKYLCKCYEQKHRIYMNLLIIHITFFISENNHLDDLFAYVHPPRFRSWSSDNHRPWGCSPAHGGFPLMSIKKLHRRCSALRLASKAQWWQGLGQVMETHRHVHKHQGLAPVVGKAGPQLWPITSCWEPLKWITKTTIPELEDAV